MRAYHDDDYGAVGGGNPSRLRTVTIVAAALAALCVIFLIGYATHGGGIRAAAGRGAPSTTMPSAPATSSPLASQSTAPAEPRGPLRRNGAGVIVGYSHDQQGAVAAAGNYTAAVYVQANRTHARELAVLTAIAASTDDATRMAGDFSSEDIALAKLLDVATLQTPGVIAYGHPVGYRVENADTRTAVVDVYVVGGQGVADAPSDSAGAGETFYEVDQVQLVWQGRDWRMSNWSHLVLNNGPELASVAAESYLPFAIGQSDSDGGTS